MSDQMQANVTDENNDYIMPNLRSLMADGVCCERAYATNPICSPSRASLMSAQLPHNHGMVEVTHNVPAYRAEYDYTLDTFSNVLKREGYATSYYGKWHVERQHCLEKFGYDEFITERKLPSSKLTPVKRTTLSTPGYDDRVIGGIYAEGQESTEEHFEYDAAMDFISRHKDGPFFTFISTNAPHDPYTVPQDAYDMYEGMEMKLPESYSDRMEDKPAVYRRLRSVMDRLSKEEFREVRRYYHAYCSVIDKEIGRMVDFLKRENLYDSTLIVVLSDHGDYQGAHGLMCKGVAAFEEAYRIPLVFKLPKGSFAGTRRDGIISIMDVGPTVLDIVGAGRIANETDGKSRKALLEGERCADNYTIAENFGQRYSYTQRIVWKDSFKYVFNAFDYDELYDLENDPGELVNLASRSEYSDKLKEMCTLMQQQILDSDDATMQNATYFMLRFAPVGPMKKQGGSGEYTIYNKVF
ncbi:MAG: sulfatase-like hydrolase/transferase [Spirochaetales bacterium]|nr:sulfatase-like hydrolase/transferase [Spirochaetales bacterium]